MDQVVTFNKTYQERLLEYMDVLSGYEVLSVSQIKKEWCFYLELTVDPNGWQAVWKIPRLRCEELKIAFPTIVLVYIENIQFQDLLASVKILAVQDDIHLPSKHYVPVIQLWPTKEQDKTVGLNLESTANSLDMLRFFYTNIFMPWDLEEEDTSDWLNKHLESRLHLFYDIRNGTIPGATAEHLKCLLTEARRLQARQEKITSEMEDIGELNPEPSAQSSSVQNVLDIRVRMVQIRNELELLEDPVLRNALLRNQQLPPKGNSVQSENWLVFEQGKVDEYITFLNQAKTHINENDNVKFASTLALALENSIPNDRILLNQSKHVFSTLGGLQEGGVLNGISSKTDTIIESTNQDIMLDCCGDLIFENLTINVGFAQCGVLVRNGEVTIKNCKIVGDGESSTHQGVIVLAGSKLKMIDCDVSKFYTAIVGNSGSEINLQNCEIFDVNIGLKVYDNCTVKAEQSQLHNCRDFGVCVETDTILDEDVCRTGGFAVLQVIPDVMLDNLTGDNNGKGDAVINQKRKLRPVSDLFGDPELDPTINHDTASSDEEMELNISSDNNADNTIIEMNVLRERSEYAC